MSTTDRSKLPRTTSKRTRFLPLPGRKSRTGLAVDTSFTQHGGRMPKQVYPPPNPPSRPQENFVSLNDIKALSQQMTVKSNRGLKEQFGSTAYLQPGPQKSVTRSYTQQSRALDSACAPVDEAPPPYKDSKIIKIADGQPQAQFVLQDPPKAKRNNGLSRPSPLKLRTDISPSDRPIPIGISVSPTDIRNHKYSLESAASRPRSSPQRQSSQRSTQGLKTPTIVITPAEEDFEADLNGLPVDLRQTSRCRPRSSVYSRYTSCLPKEDQSDRAPPVPPLPSFALESGSTVRSGETTSSAHTISEEVSPPYPSPLRKSQRAAVCPVYDDDGPNQLASASSLNSNRLSSQTHLPTPRRSRGWWNLLTSPFSASSASRTFFPSSSPVPEEEQLRDGPLLSEASRTPLSGDFMLTSCFQGDEELRSAPPTGCSRQTFASRQVRTPKRSDTAPGALDLGNADAVNIYRTPSQGTASSYYDQNRSYPSLVAPLAAEGLDRGLEQDWSPSQSVYRGSESFMPQGTNTDDRGFTNMPIPIAGEAAPYYDTTRRFPSMDEPEYADRVLNNYGTAETVFPEQRGFVSPGVGFGNQTFVESPVGGNPLQGDWSTGRNDSAQPFGSQSPGFQNDGVTPYADGATFPNDRVAGGIYNGDYAPSPRVAGVTLDADMYPTTHGSTARSPFGENYDADIHSSVERFDGDGNDSALPFRPQTTCVRGVGDMENAACDDDYAPNSRDIGMAQAALTYPEDVQHTARYPPYDNYGGDVIPPAERHSGVSLDSTGTRFGAGQMTGFSGLSGEQPPIQSDFTETPRMISAADDYSADGQSGVKDSFGNRYDVGVSPPAERLDEDGFDAGRTPFGSGQETGFSEISERHPRDQRDPFLTPDHKPHGETPILPLAARSDFDGPFDESLKNQSPSPVLEHARSARYMGTPLSNGELREFDFAREPLPMGPEANFGHDSRNGSPGFGVPDDSSEENLSNVANPFNEKGIRGLLRSEEFRPRNRDEDQKALRPWYRHFFSVLAACGTLLLVLLIVLLVMFIPLHHADMPVQAQWLNLTGFPPLPTGVATVVGANSVKDVTGCVAAEALWSCAVPPGQHRLSTTRPDQPNFRFLIRFRNGTLSNETLLEPTNGTTIKRDSGRAANAGVLVKRSAWSTYIYTSSPPPPSMEDQIFLGRTSDHVSPPYNGEETPFYISLLDPIALQPVKRSTLQKRHFRYPYPTPSDFNSGDSASSSSDSSSSTPSASRKGAENIPLPALQGNGEPAPPELYPFAYAQPLRLFNRGQQGEHYGFYTYFDRSIYVSGLSNGTFAKDSMGGDSVSSNVRRENASAVCTWSQSRLLVQIWTGKPDVTTLNPTANASSIPAVNSTANDMASPGSFPYAVTITLDRHGGDASMKGVYCYGLDEDHRVLQTVSTWIAENRAFDGKIINPAGIPTNNGTSLTKRDDGQGDGIDGGTSGCACRWQNFS